MHHRRSVKRYDCESFCPKASFKIDLNFADEENQEGMTEEPAEFSDSEINDTDSSETDESSSESD